jgi:hypothetical protein
MIVRPIHRRRPPVRSHRIARSLQARHATGTTTEFGEGIDINKLALNGGARRGRRPRLNRSQPRDPAYGCAPVFPWNFVRRNTIFGVVHPAGGYTALVEQASLPRIINIRGSHD